MNYFVISLVAVFVFCTVFCWNYPRALKRYKTDEITEVAFTGDFSDRDVIDMPHIFRDPFNLDLSSWDTSNLLTEIDGISIGDIVMSYRTERQSDGTWKWVKRKNN